MPGATDSNSEGSASQSTRGKRARSPIPKYNLKDTLRVARTLEDTNAGQPLPPVETALALDYSPRNSHFEQITSASIKYGLTTGNSRADAIGVTSLGQRIVAPTSEEDRAQALLESALLPDTFRRMYDFYKGKKLPDAQFLLNTIVREFDIPREHAEQCAQIFIENMEFVGLAKSRGNAQYLSTQTAAVAAPSPNDAGAPHGGHDAEEEGFGDENPAPEDAGGDGEDDNLQRSTSPRKRRPNRIFVGHGRNKRPLTQLTKTLEQLGIPHLVAENEPNVGRPISQKVRETMEQCGAAILIFSADVEYFDADGESVWKNSENVSHELGAASVMYDNRIILFKEDSVQLASNFSGIGHISFETDKLDAKVNELLRELMALKILKLSVDD